MRLLFRHHYIWLIAGIYVSMLLSPALTHIEIHDNLDVLHGWLTMLSNSGLFFSAPSTPTPFMGGLPRGYLPSPLLVQNLLYYFFTPLQAYALTIFFKILIGYYSFYFLGQYLLKKVGTNGNTLPLQLISICFAFLSGYENGYFAQTSLPLIALCYLKSQTTPRLLLSALILPFFSDFPRWGILILFFLTIHFILDFISKKKISINRLLFITILLLGYIVAEFQLFYLMLLNRVPTIRDEFNLVKSLDNFSYFFKNGLLHGQYHVSSDHRIVIIPSVLIATILYFIDRQKKEFSRQLSLLSLLLITIIFLNISIFTIYETTSLSNTVGHLFPPLASWNFGRAIWFNSLIWHILFLCCTYYLVGKNSKFIFLPLFQICFILSSESYGNDLRKTIYCHLKFPCPEHSYEEFYSKQLFSTLKANINYQNEISIAYGFHPSVLTYNGIYTADGYHNAYPLQYKHQFYALIKPSLEEADEHRKYFENWGGRAYVFSKYIDYSATKIKDFSQSHHLALDFNQAKKMGITYIFSYYNLLNENLYLITKSKNDAYKNLNVYKIIYH